MAKESAKAVAASAKVEDRWQTESDVRTLIAYNELRKDAKRLAAAQAMAAEQAAALKAAQAVKPLKA